MIQILNFKKVTLNTEQIKSWQSTWRTWGSTWNRDTSPKVSVHVGTSHPQVIPNFAAAPLIPSQHFKLPFPASSPALMGFLTLSSRTTLRQDGNFAFLLDLSTLGTAVQQLPRNDGNQDRTGTFIGLGGIWMELWTNEQDNNGDLLLFIPWGERVASKYPH